MPSRFVIHTVGPVWNGGKSNEEVNLANCYINSLRLALENNVQTIAFPNISTGIYGYPKRDAAETAIEAVSSFLQSDLAMTKLYFVCFDEENYFIYQNIIGSHAIDP